MSKPFNFQRAVLGGEDRDDGCLDRFVSDDRDRDEVGPNSQDEGVSVPTGPPWPDPLAEAAYHGLAGEYVRALEPHTEADPAAVLVQLLVAVGNVVGRGPHFAVEGDLHH